MFKEDRDGLDDALPGKSLADLRSAACLSMSVPALA